MSHYPQRFIVVDYEGEPLRKFRSKHDAEWFTEDKPDCKIVELPKEKQETKAEQMSRLLKEYGECLM
jgi:hypothetical protein